MDVERSISQRICRLEIYQSEFLVRERYGMEYSSQTRYRKNVANVVASTFVGNQISTKYYEPSHIQYIPVRQQFFDIIEMDLREENGEHATFETG